MAGAIGGLGKTLTSMRRHPRVMSTVGSSLGGGIYGHVTGGLGSEEGRTGRRRVTGLYGAAMGAIGGSMGWGRAMRNQSFRNQMIGGLGGAAAMGAIAGRSDLGVLYGSAGATAIQVSTRGIKSTLSKYGSGARTLGREGIIPAWDRSKAMATGAANRFREVRVLRQAEKTAGHAAASEVASAATALG